ncbi:MAG: hypothetical protein PHW87_11470 [Methanothrix sp.]|nr:hypothetical protein [Methanothrix sp.]
MGKLPGNPASCPITQPARCLLSPVARSYPLVGAPGAGYSAAASLAQPLPPMPVF